MTTATVSTAPNGTRGIDRLALRIGTALVLWAGRRAERNALTPERRSHRIALEQLQLDRATSAQGAMLGR
ncbi:hypothetical protein ACFFGH_10975 [Lysobacter korlensis]|uniref:Uncharacterized protein n=1 Tax=Lysobacter korlensis TaxID=553636 RepID=A0ABV6RMZ9_9GAMM